MTPSSSSAAQPLAATKGETPPLGIRHVRALCLCAFRAAPEKSLLKKHEITVLQCRVSCIPRLCVSLPYHVSKPCVNYAAGRRIRASPALRFTSLSMSADITSMPIYGHHFEPGQLQFITTSTYRRSRLFTCQRFCWTLVETLRQVRQETGFLLIGWVLMPEHFHLLIKPQPAEDTVHFMQELKKRSAQQIIAALSKNQEQPRTAHTARGTAAL